jgi:hypothetical protein
MPRRSTKPSWSPGRSTHGCSHSSCSPPLSREFGFIGGIRRGNVTLDRKWRLRSFGGDAHLVTRVAPAKVVTDTLCRPRRAQERPCRVADLRRSNRPLPDWSSIGTTTSRRSPRSANKLRDSNQLVDEAEGAQRGKNFIRHILAGTKPADFPLELPTRFRLIVNLKAAKGN